MIYLDNAATTKQKFFAKDYSNGFMWLNANANYAFSEKRLMQECEERTKTAIGAKGGKVVFGGTTSQLVENLMCYIICGQNVNNKNNG